MKNTIKLHTFEFECLCEAFRRFEQFHLHDPSEKCSWSIKDLCRVWTGLGTQTDYQQAYNNGYMMPSYAIQKGVSGWWRLTEKGAKVLLHWKNNGVYSISGEWNIAGNPSCMIDKSV